MKMYKCDACTKVVSAGYTVSAGVYSEDYDLCRDCLDKFRDIMDKHLWKGTHAPPAF